MEIWALYGDYIISVIFRRSSLKINGYLDYRIINAIRSAYFQDTGPILRLELLGYRDTPPFPLTDGCDISIVNKWRCIKTLIPPI